MSQVLITSLPPNLSSPRRHFLPTPKPRRRHCAASPPPSRRSSPPSSATASPCRPDQPRPLPGRRNVGIGSPSAAATFRSRRRFRRRRASPPRSGGRLSTVDHPVTLPDRSGGRCRRGRPDLATTTAGHCFDHFPASRQLRRPC